MLHDPLSLCRISGIGGPPTYRMSANLKTSGLCKFTQWVQATLVGPLQGGHLWPSALTIYPSVPVWVKLCIIIHPEILFRRPLLRAEKRSANACLVKAHLLQWANSYCKHLKALCFSALKIKGNCSIKSQHWSWKTWPNASQRSPERLNATPTNRLHLMWFNTVWWHSVLFNGIRYTSMAFDTILTAFFTDTSLKKD